MAVAPAEFPPPVDSSDEFLGPPTDPEDERIEVGVAIVGGGQAGLACAIRLLQLLEDDPDLTERLGEVPVAVLEKGKVAGAHQLSGGVMNPASIRELFPEDDSWPHYGQVEGESVRFMLNSKRSVPLWPVPPPFRNHGNYVVAVAELNRWLAEKAEEAGAYILSETAAQKLLVEDGVVRGVRTGDKGRDKEGGEKSNFEPGSDVTAQATVLAEGCWGHLTGAALRGLDLAPKDPQVWALGVKEIWEVSQPLHKIIHTLGWPLRPQAKYKEFGGSWIYGMNREGEAPKVSLGFVVGLDWADARISPHDILQEFKLHPLVRKILDGGKRVGWGAKAIPEGGYWAMPKLHAPGMVIAGDSAGMVNVPRLKGIHYAIKSGCSPPRRSTRR
jgi:electron-transferring-flavoprotein dehydrogenase